MPPTTKPGVKLPKVKLVMVALMEHWQLDAKMDGTLKRKPISMLFAHTGKASFGELRSSG